ncbi:MAG: coproporphyrinogen III oxidase, partial [Dehalococcoidia bacterium]|nr:coproporphyrinogen III oxidase [Dehalococcoidia bacterium]
RLSFGAQSFDDARLRELGRTHTADDIRRAVEDARAAGFANIGLDLIHSLPGHDRDEWRATLQAALALETEHLSAYGLTIEPHTVFGWRQRRGLLTPVDPDTSADLSELTAAILTEAGFDHYEIANFARPGYQCRHNLTYWRNEPFLAFGAGAHGSTLVARFANHRVFARYLAAAETWDGPTFAADAVPEATGPIDWVEALSPETQRVETLMLGLRLAEGVDCDRFADRHGVDPRQEWADQIAELMDSGMLTLDGARLRLTAAGRLLADDVVARLIA